jgi:hypothetical protein
MESNHRYFARRAAQELTAASRAMTPQAREWHRELAEGFTRKAQEQAQFAAMA